MKQPSKSDMYSSRSSWQVFAWPILLGVFLPVFGSLLSIWLIPDWRWSHILFHSVVEASGGMIALVMVGFWWISGKANDTRSPFFWLMCGLISMGGLDIFHAVVHPGKNFVWFHSTAHFAGGLFFSGVIAQRWIPSATKIKPFFFLTFIITVVFGALSLLNPAWVPPMVENGSFTGLAKGLNIIGGFGFFSASWFFVHRYFKSSEKEDYLLSTHCLLLGSAGVLFEVSTLWDGAWWWWHALRLIAYGMSFTIILEKSQVSYHQLQYKNQSVLEAAVDAIITINEKGIIGSVNPAGERLTGYTADELIGQNVKMLMPAPYRNEHDGYIKNYLTTGEKKIIGVGREVVVQRKDASAFPAELAVSEVDFNGHKMFTGILRDITERKQYEEEIREALIRTKSILDTAVDAIIAIDEKGTIGSVNPAGERLTGYTADELIGQNVKMLMPAPYRNEHDGYIKNYLTTGEKKIIGVGREVVVQRKDGSAFPAELAVSEMDFGNFKMFTGILRDITERKQSEESLCLAKEAAESSARAKSEFLANMSHEIRTPMNGVIGMTQLLMDTDLTLEQKEFGRMIQYSAESLLTIINDVLDFSKIEAGKLDVETIPFDFNVAIDELIDLVSLKAQEKDFEFIVSIDPNVPSYLTGDPGRIRQILLNFLTNAFKFTETGHVLLNIDCVERTEKQVSLHMSVQDTGKGIATDKINKLFDQFTQEDSSTTRNYGGTGLGLAICKKLVELMGGQIGAKSDLDKGSTFWFVLPLEISDNVQEVPLVMPDCERAKTLVVDDNEITVQVICTNLKKWGIPYDSAPSAEIALEKLRAAQQAGEPFEIAIIDYVMPGGMNGEALGREIKQDETLKNTALIMQTAYSQRGHAKRFEEIGFSAYLIKPVNQSTLLNTLTAIRARQTGESDKRELITRFTVKEEQKRPESHEQKGSFEGEGFRILLAEDNVVNQKVATRLLQKLGLRVDVAANGQEVVQMSSMIPYDLLFMDCQMPEMDGFEATKYIRQRESGEEHIPIVALTANAMKGDQEACLNAGMDDYLAKPVNANALEKVLTKWLKHATHKV